MKKKNSSFFSFLSILLVAITLFSFPLNVSAFGENTTGTFYVKYSEPYCSDTSGYMSVMYTSSSGTFRLCTYFWVISHQGDNQSTSEPSARMSVQVHRNSITFTPLVSPGCDWNYTLACFDWQDNLNILYSSKYFSAGTLIGDSYTANHSSQPLYGFIYGGNYQHSSSSTLNSVPTPTINWNRSSDGYIVNSQLNQIITSLNNIDGDTTSIINKLISVYNENVSTNTKLDNMIYLLEMIEYYLACPSDESLEEMEELKENSSSQSNKLNDLNAQSSNKNKIDPSSGSQNVDNSIDYNAIGSYGLLLATITGHGKILSMLLSVFAMVTISFVLFGKRK